MNKIILSLLAGVAIGVLIAPDKGSETMKKIRGRVNDLKDQASDKANDLISQGKEVFRNGQSRVNEVID
jgi:gas vesicle protein